MNTIHFCALGASDGLLGSLGPPLCGRLAVGLGGDNFSQLRVTVQVRPNQSPLAIVQLLRMEACADLQQRYWQGPFQHWRIAALKAGGKCGQ